MALAIGSFAVALPSVGAVEEFQFTPLASIYRQDFEFGSGGWISGGVRSSWALGTPSKLDGPDSASSGLRAWGTNLVGAHNANECSWVAGPAISIPPRGARIGTDSVSAARLAFRHWAHAELAYDGGVVQVSNDGGHSWRQLVAGRGALIEDARACVAPEALPGETVRGYTGWVSNEWVDGTADITPFLGQRVHFRFLFGSDETQEGLGWVIDDVRVQVGAGT